MQTQTDGKRLLSDVIVHTKYARFREDLGRRETWEEIAFRSEQMHKKQYPHLQAEIAEAFTYIRQRKILPSMRSAQFAGRAIETKNNRIYNCAYTPADSVVSVQEIFYNLLCGSGVGYSVQAHHIRGIPKIKGFRDFSTPFVIRDTIEGWVEAVGELFDRAINRGPRPDFQFHLIRKAGAPLVTSGGTAPGPDPLREALEALEAILDKAKGRRLRSLEVHDVLCHMAEAVHSGGIRRAAMIAFFDRWDRDMLTCKAGDWAGYVDKITGQWVPGSWRNGYNPQRGRANNSAVFLRGDVTSQDFRDFWEIVKENNTGEPGIYWTWDRDHLGNPCVEIALPPQGFCNLTTVNGATCETEREFIQRVIMAARVGTFQAGYTDFPFLRPSWAENCAKEALLGVSITGIGAGRLCKFSLSKAAAAAVAENRRIAKLIGINPAARVTCLKPEGTGSLVLGTPSGIHAWHSPFYYRTIRVGKNEAIHDFLAQNLPGLLEDDAEKPEDRSVLRIPIQANPGGYFRQNETALDLLERVKHYTMGWVRPGHFSGPNTHNISCTASVKPDEWGPVGAWMWDNREFYNGLTVLPYWPGSYRQAPFVECSQEEYLEGVVQLQDLDLTMIREDQDNTNLAGELACSGGFCEL